MKNKKYEITDIEHETINGLFRIRRLSDGLIGGFVSGYHNLSQDGECFIFDNAVISGEMRLIGSARAYGNVFIYGSGIITESCDYQPAFCVPSTIE